MTFPKDFIWGVATSSYQIEGAALEDGRGECIWTRFSHTPGNVANNETGDVACDHYHRYQEDVGLMKQLGLNAYRFSVSWPRVLPQGYGERNAAGLDFYDRLVDELLQANVQPFLTLYHWDLPQTLQEQGGWANPAIVQWFADYAGVMAERLGDRVKDWMTLNEPFVSALIGYWEGRHAPGIQDLPTAYRAAHHLHLAHGAAMDVLREQVPDGKLGIAINVTQFDPLTEDEKDVLATQRMDGFVNRWFLDPVFKGSYPADIVEILGDVLNGIDLDEVKQAAKPMDFLGINYYFRSFVAWNDNQSPLNAQSVFREEVPHTEMGWEISPESFTKILVRVNKDYSPEGIYITENGASFADPAPQNGVVEDPLRIDYLKGHLEAVEKALEQGVPMQGYFLWSFMDNFEWAHGYSKPFGIVHVNFDTQERTFKRSAYWYRDFIRSNSGG
jgi:beta-glucosidase